MHEFPNAPTTARAGDFDYDYHGHAYTTHRRTDPRIAARVHDALGSAEIILNVGAGAGSYEPTDGRVIPIEPSAVMRSQRPPYLAAAIAGVAERLPLGDQSVDAAMATLTVHQWQDVERGLGEMVRVTRGAIVILTFDGEALDRFEWLAAYAPELFAAERRRYPPIDDIRAALGGSQVEVQPVPIPIDCADGFTEAFYARPERMLEPAVRQCQSAWAFVSEDVQRGFVQRLRADLESGEWDRKYGDWRRRPRFDGAMRLVVRRSM
jgi:SAM-dependent methyltransferase